MKVLVNVLLLTALLQNPIYASEPFFSDLFSNYLDGPTLGEDNSLYFSSESKLFSIDGADQLSLILDFSKLAGLEKVPRIAGITKGTQGELLLADYKNQRIWSIPYTDKKYRPDKLSVLIDESEMKQPNDIDLFDKNHLVAADHNKDKRDAGFWLFNIKNQSEKSFFKTGGKLTGIAVSGNNVFVSSALPCYVASYKINIANKPLLNWKRQCIKDWSVDGMTIKDDRIYITRIELGRIDVLNTHNGELLAGYCLLRNRYFGRIQETYGFNDSPSMCRVTEEYELGKNPTDLTFISDKELAISFIGKSSEGSKKNDKGYIDIIKILD